MTATIIGLLVGFFYIIGVLTTMFVLTMPQNVLLERRRVTLAVVFWPIFWLTVLFGVLFDMMRGARHV